MPKAFTPHEKELIHQRLLEQGYRLFSAYGLKKTNIAEIASAAGISKGAFYIFYGSKEELFMDVVEQVENRVRREVLAVIDQPGPSPRRRLVAVLKMAFDQFESMPILQYTSGSDFELLFRRISLEKYQDHLSSDLAFIATLIARCRTAGIPIQVGPEEISGLLYPLVLSILHKDELGVNALDSGIDLLLELVAAYCLGEVEVQR